MGSGVGKMATFLRKRLAQGGMKRSTKGSEMAEQGKVKEVPESCTLLAGMCTVLKMSKEGRDFAAAFQRIRM